MIVIDTNILAYRVLADADPALTAQAERVLAQPGGILVPTLWRHEFLNVLTTQLKQGLLNLEMAEELWYQVLALVQEVEAPVDMPRALALAAQFKLSAYDAQFVALAESAHTVLVTEDKRLRKAVGDRAMSMQEYLAA